MEQWKKGKDRPGAASPLSPEAEARLADQMAGLMSALESGADVATLRENLTPDPADPQWDVRLMAALGALSHPAIPNLLVTLFGEARDKIRRKALKRALHLPKARRRRRTCYPYLRQRRKLCHFGRPTRDFAGQLPGFSDQR
jgi:hypothetical protein